MTQTPTDALRLVPSRITPEMAHALESNFAECIPPSPIHAANWQEAWSKCLAVAPDVMCCDNCGTIKDKADECDCSRHDGTPPVWVSAAPASPLPGGGDWGAIRNVFVRHAEAFVKAPRYEEASAIADKAAREIQDLMLPLPAAPTGAK